MAAFVCISIRVQTGLFFKSVCLMLEVCNYGQIMGEADGIRKSLMGLSTQLPS